MNATEQDTMPAPSGVLVSVEHDDFMVKVLEMANEGHARYETEALYTAKSFADMVAVAIRLSA